MGFILTTESDVNGAIREPQHRNKTLLGLLSLNPIHTLICTIRTAYQVFNVGLWDDELPSIGHWGLQTQRASDSHLHPGVGKRKRTTTSIELKG